VKGPRDNHHFLQLAHIAKVDQDCGVGISVYHCAAPPADGRTILEQSR